MCKKNLISLIDDCEWTADLKGFELFQPAE